MLEVKLLHRDTICRPYTFLVEAGVFEYLGKTSPWYCVSLRTLDEDVYDFRVTDNLGDNLLFADKICKALNDLLDYCTSSHIDFTIEVICDKLNHSFNFKEISQ